MKDSNRIVTRALEWDGDRQALYELLPDVKTARINAEKDALRGAVVVLLENRELPTIQRVQLNIYRIQIDEDDELKAYGHLLKAEEGIAELDRICLPHDLRDPRVQQLKNQAQKFRLWFEDQGDFEEEARLKIAKMPDLKSGKVTHVFDGSKTIVAQRDSTAGTALSVQQQGSVPDEVIVVAKSDNGSGSVLSGFKPSPIHHSEDSMSFSSKFFAHDFNGKSASNLSSPPKPQAKKRDSLMPLATASLHTHSVLPLPPASPITHRTPSWASVAGGPPPSMSTDFGMPSSMGHSSGASFSGAGDAPLGIGGGGQTKREYTNANVRRPPAYSSGAIAVASGGVSPSGDFGPGSEARRGSIEPGQAAGYADDGTVQQQWSGGAVGSGTVSGARRVQGQGDKLPVRTLRGRKSHQDLMDMTTWRS